MQILCSKALGRGDLRESNGNFSLAVTTALALMISSTGATFLFTGQLADILGAGENLGVIRSLTVDYLQAFSLSLPALALVTILTPIMQLDSDRNRAVFATVVLSLSDIVADLVSVFVFDGGLWGIGLATAVSYWIAAGVLPLHFVKPNASFAYLPEAMHVKSLREMFFSGMTMIIGRGSSVLTVSILTRISLAILPCALSLLSNYYAARKFRLATVTTILNKLVVFAVTCHHCGRITFRLEDYLLLPEDLTIGAACSRAFVSRRLRATSSITVSATAKNISSTCELSSTVNKLSFDCATLPAVRPEEVVRNLQSRRPDGAYRNSARAEDCDRIRLRQCFEAQQLNHKILARERVQCS